MLQASTQFIKMQLNWSDSQQKAWFEVGKNWYEIRVNFL